MTSENKITKNAKTLPSVAGCTVVAVLLVTVVMMAPAVNNFPAAAGQLDILEMQQNQTGQPEGPSEATNITSPPTPPSTDSLGSVLRLSNANIEIDIPMMRGFENGN